MIKPWVLGIHTCYHGLGVPDFVLSEPKRLDSIFAKHCRGPYDHAGTELGLGLFLEARDGKPFDLSCIKLESSRDDPGYIYGNIYMKSIDWDLPLTLYQRNLWESAEKALAACVRKLRKSKIAIDREKLRDDLSIVEVEFLGYKLKYEDRHLKKNPGWMPLNPGKKESERKIVVQYRIQKQASVVDHDMRVKVENILGEALETAGIGDCDGGDIGSGTMNIVCFVKPNAKGSKLIIELLRRNDLLSGAVIAETVNGQESVIWPPDFSGEFELI